MNYRLRPGDVVVHRSNGQRMVITEARQMTGSHPHLVCSWIDRNGGGHEAVFMLCEVRKALFRWR